MAITRDFRETVQARALRDPEFREGMLRESIECMLAGDFKTGKVLLRDYIKAVLGFEKLAKITKKDPKSLMRMLSAEGNPTASNLFDVICALEKREHIQYHLSGVRGNATISRWGVKYQPQRPRRGLRMRSLSGDLPGKDISRRQAKGSP